MIEIIEESASAIEQYAYVPSRYEVREVLVLPVPDPTLTGLPLELCTVDPPYVKNYDRLAGNHPTQWGERFELRCWGFLGAWVEGRRLGGAAIAWDTPGLDMLEGRHDLAVLWDLRVAPAAWRRGIGSALFRAAEAWAIARGASRLKVETQNVNVPACRFYARQSCTLGAIHRFAYPELPHEIQLLWYKDLPPGRHRAGRKDIRNAKKGASAARRPTGSSPPRRERGSTTHVIDRTICPKDAGALHSRLD